MTLNGVRGGSMSRHDSSGDEPQFEPACPGDAEALSTLARSIWQRHYRPRILTQGELEFFLERGYAPAVLSAHMQTGVAYEWISLAGRRIGFLAYRTEADERRVHLGKLYLDPGFHGRGFGALALSRVFREARQAGIDEVYLYVFRNNEKAIRAYVRAGFVIDRAVMTECGDGYRYDDYLMIRRGLRDTR